MKKVWYIALVLYIVLFYSACSKTEDIPPKTGVEAEDAQTDYVTVVRLNSPPVCKTTTDKTIIQKVKALISSLPKTEYNGPPFGGWLLKIDFGDGARFTLARSVITIDGKAYSIKDTDYTWFHDAVMDIYADVDAKEIRYTMGGTAASAWGNNKAYNHGTKG